MQSPPSRSRSTHEWPLTVSCGKGPFAHSFLPVLGVGLLVHRCCHAVLLARAPIVASVPASAGLGAESRAVLCRCGTANFGHSALSARHNELWILVFSVDRLGGAPPTLAQLDEERRLPRLVD
jgi:hypothetical protein